MLVGSTTGGIPGSTSTAAGVGAALGAPGLVAAVLLSVIVGDATVVAAIDMVPWSIDSCGSAGRVSAATLSAAALPALALLDGDAVVPAVDPLEHPATSAAAAAARARSGRGRLMIPPGSSANGQRQTLPIECD